MKPLLFAATMALCVLFWTRADSHPTPTTETPTGSESEAGPFQRGRAGE
jgi:hypothetical protein